MNLHTLLPVVRGRKKRVGRGMGSGKGGHTTGRGQKGQKARGKIAVSFFGLKMKKSLLKRIPLQRGKGKFKARPKPVVIGLAKLSHLPEGATVDVETLVKAGLLKQREASRGAKIVKDTDSFNRKLDLKIPVTRSVQELLAKMQQR